MNSTLKCLVLLSCILLTFKPAEAQITDTWTGSVDNQWTNGNNWSAGVPPGMNDEAWFDLTSTVTLPGAGTTIFAMVVDNAPVILNAPAATFTTEQLGIGNSGILTLNIASGGTFDVTGDGNFVGDTAFFGVPSSGTFTVTGNGTLAFTSTGEPFFVGAGANGVMNQTGGTVSFSGLFTVGSDSDFFTITPATGTGVYNLSGTSTLTITDEMDLGASSSSTAPTSTGILNITSGLVDASSGVISLGVSQGATTVNGDTGVINQSGGTLDVLTLNVGESSGGFGSYSLSSTGVFSVGTLNIGDQAGASGTLTMTGSTSGTITTAMNVGESGTGLANIAGTLDILTGAGLTVGDQAGAVGILNQIGGTVTTTGTGSITVGNNGTGVYNFSGGTITSNGVLNIGAGTGSGTFTMSGSTVLNLNGGATLGGGGGTGVFNDDGGTIIYGSSVVVNSGSTFNQDGGNNTPSSVNPIVLESGATYNLTSGTLTIGGDFETLGSSGINGTTGANFNFGGGTMVLNSALNDELNGTVTGNSTIDTTAASGTLSGDLTGGGTLTVIGGGSLDIDTSAGDSSAGAWGINVVDGTVNALATTFPSSGAITIGASGIVNMTTNGTNELTGALAGSGAFNVNFSATTDTLELGGPVNFTGVTTLGSGGTAGTLQVLSGSLGDIGETAAGNNVIIGAGSGSGIVSLTGNNTYSGLTTVEPNYQLLAHDFTGAVTNNGTLGSNTALGSTPGTPTVTIGGDLISTGTLLINTQATVADLYQVGGTANISGPIDLVVPPATSSTNTIVTSTGLTYTGPTQFSGNRFVTIGVTTTADDLILNTTVNTTGQISGLNLTPNQAAIAGPLNSLLINSSNLNAAQFANFSKLLNDIGRTGTSNSQLAANIDQIGPQSLQYAPTIAILNATSMVQSVDSFANDLHHDFTGFDTAGINIIAPGFDSALGREMQSSFLAYDPSTGGYHSAAPNGVNYYPGSDSSSPVNGGTISDSAPTGASESPVPSSSARISDTPVPLRTEPESVTLRKPWSRFSAFIGADVTVADINQDQGITYAPSSKASYSAIGAVGGIAYRMTSNLSVGALMDYTHTDAKTDNYGSKMDVNTYSPGVFATYGYKGFFVNGLFTYGVNDYSDTRSVPVAGSKADSNPNGTQYVGDLDAGYEFHPARDWTLTPLAGLTYTHLDVDSFTETGASPDNLDVAAQHDDSLRSRLGASMVYTVHPGQLTLQPNLTLMWQHEFMDENPLITSSFSDISSQTFSLHSVAMGRDSALVGIGITATLDNSMAFFLNCMADANGNYNAENIVGGFRSSF